MCTIFPSFIAAYYTYIKTDFVILEGGVKKKILFMFSLVDGINKGRNASANTQNPQRELTKKGRGKNREDGNKKEKNKQYAIVENKETQTERHLQEKKGRVCETEIVKLVTEGERTQCSEFPILQSMKFIENVA